MGLPPPPPNDPILLAVFYYTYGSAWKEMTSIRWFTSPLTPEKQGHICAWILTLHVYFLYFNFFTAVEQNMEQLSIGVEASDNKLFWHFSSVLEDWKNLGERWHPTTNNIPLFFPVWKAIFHSFHLLWYFPTITKLRELIQTLYIYCVCQMEVLLGCQYKLFKKVLWRFNFPLVLLIYSLRIVHSTPRL